MVRARDDRIHFLRGTVLRLGRKRLGEPPRRQRERVESCRDTAQLEAWTERILEVESWKELPAPE